MASLDNKLAVLERRLQELSPLAIAFSGGVDSTLLLKVAVDTLGPENVLAITADSPVSPMKEIRRAKELAELFAARHVVARSGEFDDPAFLANNPDRCYVCKHRRFQQLLELAAENGIAHLADGTNVDDEGDYRPGLKAAEELGVASPLRDAGLGKEDIRQLSRRFGLPTAELPSFACLASRVPYGTPIEERVLRRIEQGEELLAELELKQYRLRHHGDIARIEVLPEDFPVVMAAREKIDASLRALGYKHVTLDLAGYRTGSLNEGLRDYNG